MIAKIMCGGPYHWFDSTNLSEEIMIIGVDRGTLFLLNKGIIPDVAIGDFDSIQLDELEKIEQLCPQIIKLSCEKDETDTEVAIHHAISLGATEIYVYGAMGGRLDHTIANIRLLLQFIESGAKLSIVDQTNIVCLLAKGEHQFSTLPYKYVSFFAMNQTVNQLTLKGLKYPLQNYQLTQADVRCISNEILDESFSVSFESGYLLMINSAD